MAIRRRRIVIPLSFVFFRFLSSYFVMLVYLKKMFIDVKSHRKMLSPRLRLFSSSSNLIFALGIFQPRQKRKRQHTRILPIMCPHRQSFKKRYLEYRLQYSPIFFDFSASWCRLAVVQENICFIERPIYHF